MEIATFLRLVELLSQRTWQNNVRESTVPIMIWSIHALKTKEDIFYDSSEYSENVKMYSVAMYRKYIWIPSSNFIQCNASNWILLFCLHIL